MRGLIILTATDSSSGLRQAGFDGDLEARVFALQRGTPVHATTEEVSD
jgi:hypothetical protein